MHFGASTVLWTAQPDPARLPALVRRAAAAGADWIELPLYGDSLVLDADDTAALLRGHSLGLSVCTALGLHEDIASADAAVRATGEASLNVCVAQAARMGARLIVGSFRCDDLATRPADESGRQRALDHQSAVLRRVAARAADAGLMLAIEPINRYESCHVNTIEQALALTRRVDHPALGVMMDTFHAHLEEVSIAAAVRAAGAKLLHVHANESHRGIPGQGAIDWQAVRDALRGIGFDGALVIETFDVHMPEQAVGGRMWRALGTSGSSGDDIAQQGLAFLRRALV
jgi:D-psicose/D-tagatose/L-ribulose 3-epimerase